MDNNFTKKRGRAKYGFSSCAVALTLLTLVSTGTSWAFSTYDGYNDVPSLKVKSVSLETRFEYEPSSAMTDTCLPLLKTVRKTSTNLVIDRNQRSAGKVAALGLIFGVRYALTPSGNSVADKASSQENDAANFDIWYYDGHSVQDESNRALAVSAYRSCQKKQALSALNDFR